MAIGKGVQLVVSIVGDTAGLSKSLDSATGDVKGFGIGALGTAAKVSIVAGAAVAAGAAIYGMAKAASADRAEQQKLEAAIAAVGASTADTTAQVDAAIAAGQEKAFTDSETRDALQSLVTATKDVGAATTLLADAQNIARLAGVDLATAADAVAKAQAGSDGALRKLIPGLEKGASATDTLAAASKAAAGQADLFAKSSEGLEARAGDAFGELTETIGEVFLPILDAIIPALIPILKAFGELIKAILPVLVPLIKALGAALTIVANIFVKLLDIIKSILTWVIKLLSPIGDLIDALGKLNPFNGFTLPKIGGSMATPSGAMTRAGGGGGGNITMNLYGDPAVMEARIINILRGYARRNGVTIVNPLNR
jgi:hypothetical protein